MENYDADYADCRRRATSIKQGICLTSKAAIAKRRLAVLHTPTRTRNVTDLYYSCLCMFMSEMSDMSEMLPPHAVFVHVAVSLGASLQSCSQIFTSLSCSRFGAFWNLWRQENNIEQTQ